MQTVKIGGQELHLNTDASMARAVERHIQEKLLDLKKYVRELNGHVNGHQYETILYTLQTEQELTDPEGYAQKLADFWDWFPDPYEIADEKQLIQRVKEIRDAHMAVHDHRLTDEQVAEQKRVLEEQNRAENDRQEKIRQQLGYTAEEIETPSGMMAVYLQCTYNDSDIYAEHYHPDAGYGQPQLLAHVRKGARTEKLARSVLSKYPELARLNWTWKKSDGRYATPHLVGPTMGVCEHLHGHKKESPYIYRVYLDCYREKIPAYKNFGNRSAVQKTPAQENKIPDFQFEVKIGGLNVAGKTDRDWTWLEFSAQPTPKIVGGIESLLFTQSKKNPSRWFAKDRIPQEKIMIALSAENSIPAEKNPAEEIGGMKIHYMSSDQLISSIAAYAFTLDRTAADYQEFKAYLDDAAETPVDPPFEIMTLLDELGFTALDKVWITEEPIYPQRFIDAVKIAQINL